MSEGKKTLAQVIYNLLNPKPVVLESKIYNPLPGKARRGDTLRISDCLAVSPETALEIVEIDEYRRVEAGKVFLSVDYLCKWMNGDTEDWLTVRLSPGDSGPDSIDALVLLKDWDGSYKDKWVKRLLEVELPTGLYKVHDPEDQRKILKTFNRPVPGLTDPYNVTVREVKTGSNDISSYNSQYWDFVRNLSEEEGGGQEFYFVEADIDWENDTNSTRLMRAYVAQPITLSSIELIKTADLLDAQKA